MPAAMLPFIVTGSDTAFHHALVCITDCPPASVPGGHFVYLGPQPLEGLSRRSEQKPAADSTVVGASFGKRSLRADSATRWPRGEAGLVVRSNGLRKLCLTRLAEAGCTVNQIGDLRPQGPARNPTLCRRRRSQASSACWHRATLEDECPNGERTSGQP